MTLKRTGSGTIDKDHEPGCKKTGTKRMLYTMDERQLLRLWSVMHCFAQIREINDPVTQSEILTNAQMLLTAFVLDLKPLVGDQTSSAPSRTSLGQIVTFDA
jgi:hypothetical protein